MIVENAAWVALSMIALLIVPATAQAQPAASTTGTTSNGSSTGVGNAGSFGIGSGTSDSLSTATAVSNGVTDNSVDNSVDSSTSITTVSVQDLRASTTDNQLVIVGSSNPASPTVQTGSNLVNGGAFSNYAGILSNGWNTGPAAVAQAATNVAVNGNLTGR